MKLEPQEDDAAVFIDIVERTLVSIERECKPADILLVKLDNWFGSRWWGFQGKVLGAAGVTRNLNKYPADSVTIPPFVPSRVVTQRRFLAPSYEEVAAGKPLHRHISSSLALGRRATVEAPGKSLVWYSGNSDKNGCGSLMAYVRVESTYWPWYVSMERGAEWRITEARGIKPEQFYALAQKEPQPARSEVAPPKET